MSDAVLNEFIRSSYELLRDYPKNGRYFHTLRPTDNSPLVIHQETNQLSHVLSGRGRVWLNGKERNICAGDSLLVPAGTTHRFAAETEEMILFHIHIPDSGRETDRIVIEGADYDRFK